MILCSWNIPPSDVVGSTSSQGVKVKSTVASCSVLLVLFTAPRAFEIIYSIIIIIIMLLIIIIISSSSSSSTVLTNLAPWSHSQMLEVLPKDYVMCHLQEMTMIIQG